MLFGAEALEQRHSDRLTLARTRVRALQKQKGHIHLSVFHYYYYHHHTSTVDGRLQKHSYVSINSLSRSTSNPSHVILARSLSHELFILSGLLQVFNIFITIHPMGFSCFTGSGICDLSTAGVCPLFAYRPIIILIPKFTICLK